MRAITCVFAMAVSFSTSTTAVAAAPPKPADRWDLSSVNSNTGWCSFSNKNFGNWVLSVQRTKAGYPAKNAVMALDNAKKDAEAYLAQRGVVTSLKGAFGDILVKDINNVESSAYWVPASNSLAFVFTDHFPLYRVIALADDPEYSYTLILSFSPPLESTRPPKLGPEGKVSMHREMIDALQKLGSFDRCTPG